MRGGYPAIAPDFTTGHDGFKAGFFATLAELEIGNFCFESRNRLLV